MWITKKKLDRIKTQEYVRAMKDEMTSSEEYEQTKRIAKLEKQVKKLKKAIKNGW